MPLTYFDMPCRRSSAALAQRTRNFGNLYRGFAIRVSWRGHGHDRALAPLGDPPSSATLEKNSLDADSVSFLKIGRSRVRLVEEYFDEHHDPNLGDQIAQAMRTQYQTLAATGFESNEVLVKLQQFAGWGRRDSSHDAAVLAVIVYFLDRCDIFEDPDEQNIEAARTKP